MNVRSLCVSRVARDAGEPWLWWEYVDKMGEECKMKDRKFDTDCSEKVGFGFAVSKEQSNLRGPSPEAQWSCELRGALWVCQDWSKRRVLAGMHV